MKDVNGKIRKLAKKGAKMEEKEKMQTMIEADMEASSIDLEEEDNVPITHKATTFNHSLPAANDSGIHRWICYAQLRDGTLIPKVTKSD